MLGWPRKVTVLAVTAHCLLVTWPTRSPETRPVAAPAAAEVGGSRHVTPPSRPRPHTATRGDDTPVALRAAVVQARQLEGGASYRALPAAETGTFVATNASHAFDVQFDAAGASVHSRTPVPPLRLGVTGVGPRGDIHAVTFDSWTADEGPIARRGRTPAIELTEWYLNGPLGLEQGFTIHSGSPRPGGPKEAGDEASAQEGGGLLEVHVAIGEGWSAQTARDGLEFAPDRGGVGGPLRYGHLAAWDATGRELATSLRLADSVIVLDVDVARAIYPVTIDPLLQQPSEPVPQQARLVAGDGDAEDLFGYSVAISGDTAVVGASRDDVDAAANQGSAYVFVRSGTSWALQARLFPGDGAAGDCFGQSVAVNGDTAVVGAPGHVSSSVRSGAAYVFLRNGGVWTQQARLIASDGKSDDWFGESVAVSGDTVLVGAPRKGIGVDAARGATYVFVASGGFWTQQARLILEDGAAWDQLGSSVAVSGDTALVGAHGRSVGANDYQGSAVVFVRSGGVWTQQAQLVASDGGPSDVFGSSVALSGDTALVGAPQHVVVSRVFNSQAGAAYVFVRSGGAWTQQAKLIPNTSDLFAVDRFGASVALRGDTAVVGASQDDVGPDWPTPAASRDQGSAYVFVRGGASWMQLAKVVASEGAPEEYFGTSVALSGDTILVGAWGTDAGSSADHGAAHVFVRAGNAWMEPVELAAGDGTAWDHFGFSVALSSDTAVVGAPSDDVDAKPDQGSAYVFVRSLGGWTQRARLVASDGNVGDHFGTSVALDGDTIVVGAPSDDIANYDQGSAYVFVRGVGGWTQQAKFVVSDGSSADRFGASVALSGDTVLVGASGVSGGRGAVYAFVRIDDVWRYQARLAASDGVVDDRFGASVALSGDTALIGAYGDDVAGNDDQGSAYVFAWTDQTWAEQAKLVGSDAAAGDHFGSSVALSGQTAVVGAPRDDVAANNDQGSVQTYSRVGDTWARGARIVASDGAAGDQFGTSLALSAGTLLVGAPGNTVGDVGLHHGSAYLFLRSGSWEQQPRLVAPDSTDGSGFGSSVAMSGDVLLVAAAPHLAYRGAAYAFTQRIDATPDVAAIAPSSGPAAGGTTVVITGAAFVPGATTVTFGGTEAAAVTVSSPTSLTARTPPASAGSAVVIVATAGGSSAAELAFTYASQPTVSSVAPVAGPSAGGTALEISGTGFVAGGTTVTIGGARATDVRVLSATSMTAVTPAQPAGAASVVVSTIGGSSGDAARYTYVSAPTVQAITPESGPTAGGTRVTVTGANFVPGATKVTFGGTPAASVSVATPTSLTAVTPVRPPGAAAVTVTTVGGSSVDTSPFTYVGVQTLAPGMARIVAGTEHSCLLTAAGGVRCWGHNRYGQLGDGTFVTHTSPAEVIGLASDVVGLSSSWASNHTCALHLGGKVSCWGWNLFGQLSGGINDVKATPVTVEGLPAATAVAVGRAHTCALTTDGEVWCWGYNANGQLGDGTTTSRAEPVAVENLEVPVVAVGAGGSHTCAVMANGVVKCWGLNNTGQLGDGTNTDRLTPVAVAGLPTALGIAVGHQHTCALTTDGAVKCWGYNGFGALGDGDGSCGTWSATPIDVAGLSSGASTVTAGLEFSCAVAAGGGVRCWGSNGWGQVGDGTTTERLGPAAVVGLDGGMTEVAAGRSHACAISAQGQAWCWGSNSHGQLGNGAIAESAPREVEGISGSRVLAAGWQHTCAALAKGAMCWGANAYGALGDGTSVYRSTPVGVASLSEPVTSMAAGYFFTCAVVSSGAVWCWGTNDAGQLGDGTPDLSFSAKPPRPVVGVSDATAVVAGFRHACALTSTGAVKCWGWNQYGEVGDGTVTIRAAAVDVVGLGGTAIALAATDRHTCAALLDGSVKCWGLLPGFRQNADSTYVTPVSFREPTNPVVALATDGDGLYVVTSEGAAQRRRFGGDWVGVDGLEAGVRTAAGNIYHACAVMDEGAAKCWNYNWSGQLGDGTRAYRFSPVDVIGLGQAVAVAPGDSHTCALTAGGKVVCWGADYEGQLGSGRALWSVVPVAVAQQPPALTRVAPDSGPTSGGTLITLIGSNFVAGATTVTVGGLAATNVSVTSHASLTATTPAGTAGPAAVVLSTPAGTASLAAGFLYATGGPVTVAPAAGEQRVAIQTTGGTVDVTLVGVSTGGSVNATSNAGTVDPPSGFRFLPDGVFELTSTASFTKAGVCFPYTTAQVAAAGLAEATLRLFHRTDGAAAWDDVTTAVDTVGKRVCGEVTAFSQFAIGGPLAVTHARYLAEGATSSLFDTRLALLNPGETGTTATLSFLQAGRSPISTTVVVPAHTRVTVNPKSVSGLATAEFSTKIESAQSLVVDRTMSWSTTDAYGAHAETSVVQPALVWYLAEGATHSGFNLFYLLQNPNAAEARVRVRFLLPSGAPLEKTYALSPNSRTNIWVDVEEFPGLGAALAGTDVSAVVEVLNDQPVIVERAMYLDVPGQTFGAGHESAGVTAPAMEWFLAEGATGSYFDLFILIANPGATDAEVEATYLLPDGTTLVKPYPVAANSRFNIWVDHEDVRLADTAVSTTLRSTNGVPIIVERAMWWPGDWTTWHEAHDSAGATATGTKWALAEGEVDATRNLETYILVANTSAAPADVQVTLLFEDGTSVAQTYPGIPAKSRFNVPVGGFFPQAAGRRFGAIVESLGATPAQIVVERAMYWDAAGQQWAAGTNALATRLQ